MPFHLLGCLGFKGFEKWRFSGEAGGIMYLSRPLPRLTASHQGRDEDPALCEETPGSRTQSTQALSGTWGVKRSHRRSQRRTASLVERQQP